MCTEKERYALLNLNRILIYSFGLIGLFFDYTWAYVVSMTLWVWLPNCIRFEKLLFEYWKSISGKIGLSNVKRQNKLQP